MSATELKRVLKLPAVAFIAIGFTIGGGVFVFTGLVFNIAGPALPIAYALAVVPVFISMLPIAMLGSAIPTTGANYKYPSRMVSPGLAFVGIWVYAVASFVGQIPLYALGCANYVQVCLPDISVPLVAVGILTLIFIVNLLGVKLAAQIQGVCVIILLAALIYYCMSGIAAINPQNFSNMFARGLPNLFLGTALLTFTYVGPVYRGTKSLLMIVQDRLLPEWLGRLNPRFGTPHILLSTIWILSVAGVVSGFSLETLASYATLGVLIIFIPIQVAALRLPTLYPDRYRQSDFKLKGFWLWACPLVGILMVVFFSVIILVDLGSPLKIGSFFVFILSGAVYYGLRKRYLGPSGLKPGNLLKHESTWDNR
ncbi:MAG: amino acid permease [Desulfobacterales bacterium]